MPDTPPILLLVYNRPDETRKVLERLSRAPVERLYVAADGPRDKPGDRERTDEVREAVVSQKIPAQVITLFRERNLGCRHGVNAALDWFFEHEEEGIVLEDDCVPSESFFPYCAELLERYRHDQRIGLISGSNFQRGRWIGDGSYYFSRYPHLWGWAGWRRAWKVNDRTMQRWPTFAATGDLSAWSDGSQAFEEHWSSFFDEIGLDRVDTWDWSWVYSLWSQSMLTCVANRNLVSNIGFSPTATHTTGEAWYSNLPAEDLDLPLTHPDFVVRSVDADRYMDKHVYGLDDRVSLKSLMRRYWPSKRRRERQRQLAAYRQTGSTTTSDQ